MMSIPEVTEKTLIVIPVFNEAGTIENLVREIRKNYPELEVLVVDDGSRDGSGEKARAGGAIIFRHSFNLGDGAARQTGFLYALRKGYNYVIHLDGDRQHSPGEIPLLLATLRNNEADLVMGSRFRGKCNYQLSFMKRAGMRIFSLICTLVTGQKITDPTSGFRGLNQKAIRAYATGYYPQHFPDADVIISSYYQGLRIKEIPVTMSATHSTDLHRGGKLFYYIYKMFLSIFVSTLGFYGRNPTKEKEPSRAS